MHPLQENSVDEEKRKLHEEVSQLRMSHAKLQQMLDKLHEHLMTERERCQAAEATATQRLLAADEAHKIAASLRRQLEAAATEHSQALLQLEQTKTQLAKVQHEAEFLAEKSRAETSEQLILVTKRLEDLRAEKEVQESALHVAQGMRITVLN